MLLAVLLYRINRFHYFSRIKALLGEELFNKDVMFRRKLLTNEAIVLGGGLPRGRVGLVFRLPY